MSLVRNARTLTTLDTRLDRVKNPLTTVLAMCTRGHAALTQAATIVEAQDVLAAIATLEHAIKVRNMNHEAVVAASTLRIRAERRVGEFLAIQAQRGERRPRGLSHVGPGDMRQTLTDQGLTRDESSLFQRLAAAPADLFEEAIKAVTHDAIDNRSAVTRTAVMLEIDPQSMPTASEAWKAGDRFKSACDRVTALADAAVEATRWGHFPGADPDVLISAVRISLSRAQASITRVQHALRSRI